MMMPRIIWQVHFLHEEEIVDSIAQAIQTKLKGSNESRSFSVQPITSMMGFDAKKAGGKVAAGALDGDEEEETKRGDDSDEDEASDDEEGASNAINARKSDSTSVDSQAVELDLSQKPTPPSRKYQPSQVPTALLAGCRPVALCLMVVRSCCCVQAPQRLVRTDHRASTIDKYFFLDSQRSQPTSSQSPDQASRAEDHPGKEHASRGLDRNENASPSDNTTRSRKRKLAEAMKQSSEGAVGDASTIMRAT